MASMKYMFVGMTVFWIGGVVFVALWGIQNHLVAALIGAGSALTGQVLGGCLDLRNSSKK